MHTKNPILQVDRREEQWLLYSQKYKLLKSPVRQKGKENTSDMGGFMW